MPIQKKKKKQIQAIFWFLFRKQDPPLGNRREIAQSIKKFLYASMDVYCVHARTHACTQSVGGFSGMGQRRETRSHQSQDPESSESHTYLLDIGSLPANDKLHGLLGNSHLDLNVIFPHEGEPLVCTMNSWFVRSDLSSPRATTSPP